MSSWLLALLASSQVPYELLALVFQVNFRSYKIELKNTVCARIRNC